MDNTTFADLLASTPAVDLKILSLTTELTGPDGNIDLNAAASRQHEVEQACSEAQDYVASSGRLAEALWWKAQPRSR